jgi:predicted nucleic acid-binding protein
LPLQGQPHIGREGILYAGWLKRCEVKNRQLVTAFLQDLDAGEAEAIALAIEKNADLLIIDERAGRRTAQYFGLNVVGVIGVLIEGKRTGLLRNIKPFLADLREKAGFRISYSLYRRILSDEREIGSESSPM